MSSLRDRSKARRREAIQRSAMRLFAERGYEGTTIADIAEDAEVAPRSVSMYFTTKLDLALSTANDMAERLSATIAAHPELPFIDLIDLWLTDEAESMAPDLVELTSAMLSANPQLRGASTTQMAEAARSSGPALVAQLDLPADDPMVGISAAAVGAALTSYLATARTPGAPLATHAMFMRYLRLITEAAHRSGREADIADPR